MTWLLGISAIVAVAIVLAALHRPFGDYLAHVFTSSTDWPTNSCC